MKKLFGKRGIALLTTMAILVSMVAMLGGLTLTSSAADYTPKRVISIESVNGDVNAKLLMTKTGTKLGVGKTVTIKGYYKVENYSVLDENQSPSVNLGGGHVLAHGNTDGWVAFEKTGYETSDSNWWGIEFWYTNGKISLADVTITDETNTVIYDMATDAELVAGTYTAGQFPQQQGMWYLSPYQASSTATLVVGGVYVPPYTPNRVISIESVNGDVNAKMLMTKTGTKLGVGKTVTIKGYYKVENYSVLDENQSPSVNLGGGHVLAHGNTDGWVAFEKTGYETSDSNWWGIEFWYTNGKISLADVTITDETNTVIYDMATDAELIAGTYTAGQFPQQQGMWYLSPYQASSTATLVVGEVAESSTPGSSTEPNRVISIESVNGDVNAKLLMTKTGTKLGVGKTVTIKGYYKVENYSVLDENQSPSVNLGGGHVLAHGNTDGWVAFEKTGYETSDSNWWGIEFWYTNGKISLGDVTITDETNTVIYDMAADTDLIEGTYTTGQFPQQQGMWYLSPYQASSTATLVVGAVDPNGSGSGPVTPPPIEPEYDPELVDLPEIPNMIVADSNGYTPNRAFAVINGVHNNPKASYAVFATADDYAVAGNKYYVFAKYRVYELAEGTSANITINGNVVKSLTATTTAWETLLDEHGDPYSFDAVEVDDIVSVFFDLKNGKGVFAVADFIVADQTGKIVYSLANDKTMHIETDLRYVSNGYWKGDPYVADKTGPVLFPIQTKVETYKPSAYISLTQNDKQKDSTAEAFLFFRTNNELFTAGQKYTISGMFKAQIDKGYNGNANPLLSISDSTGAAQIVDIKNHGTNGNWYPLLAPDGSAVTFKGTADEDWMKINLYCAYGTVAFADIVITDAQGKVVYDMTADEDLKALEGEYTGNVAPLGKVFLHALYNNGVGEVWFADATQSNTETSKQIPQFEESVEVPKDEDPCANGHDFVDGFCTRCEEPDPDYVPPVDDPCANGHDFVDGYCTRCQEPDPDYDPDGPAQTGDESMIFVMALGTFAVISLAALTLNKKKFNA